jgi:tRNA uridine 5-carboxymethylaminomethyl modification enzyme
MLLPFDKNRPLLPYEVTEKVEIEIKYEGYIEKQRAKVREAKRLENRIIPEDIDYDKITGLRLEACEKLKKVRPRSIGQASRISGVSPADISVLIIYTGGERDV